MKHSFWLALAASTSLFFAPTLGAMLLQASTPQTKNRQANHSWNLGSAWAAKPPAPAKSTTKKVTKKIYCWDEAGKRICSDSAPIQPITKTFNTLTGQTQLPIVSSSVIPPPPVITPEQAKINALVQAYPTEKDLLERFDLERKNISIELSDLRHQIKTTHQLLLDHLLVLSEKELMKKKISDLDHSKVKQLRETLVKARNSEIKLKERQQEMSGNQQTLLKEYRNATTTTTTTTTIANQP